MQRQNIFAFRRRSLPLNLAPLASLFLLNAQGAEQLYHIAPGSLDEVLLQISRQSGQVIAFTSDVGRYASAQVEGSLSAEQAVNAALRGSDLVLQISPAGAFIVKPGAPTPLRKESSASDTPSLGRVVTIGTRRQDITTLTSATPVDVIDAAELKHSGAVSLSQALFQLLPSFNSPQNSSSTRGQNPRGASLRGLSPDQTLVLVNGKRRHASAVVNISAGVPFAGTQLVDLDMIALSAVDHIEVLRDGASAQYGSDAVAGVINIVLKERDSGGQLNTQMGRFAQGDGLTKSTDGWYGLGLPGDGFLNLSFNGLNSKPTDLGDPYIADGALQDPRWGGVARERVNLAANAEAGLSAQWRLYGFALWTHDQSYNNTAPLLAASPNNVRAIYPDGSIPNYRYRYEDVALTVGSRFEDEAVGRFDLSATYGRDHHDEQVSDTLNPSYGVASPTRFNVVTLINEQLNLGVDYTHDVALRLLANPLTVSAGLAWRNERYRLQPGDPASYSYGGVDGVQVGAVQASGLMPDDAGTYTRQVSGLYLGLENQLSDHLQLGFAARSEHYSDFGSTTTGKLSARYDFTPKVGLRATLNNAYRAPSLGQIGTSWTTTTNNDGNGNGLMTRILPVNHPAAVALGAQQLKPEQSTNYSLGLVLRPSEAASLTVDAYQITIRDRILFSGGISGPQAERILADAGFAQYRWAQFMTNAADTRSRGVDVVGKYALDLGIRGSLALSAGFTQVHTRLQKVHANPNGFEVLTRESRGYLEHGYPDNKLILGAVHTLGPWVVSVSATRFGEYRKYAALASNASYDQTFGPQWVADLDVSYAFNHHLKVSAGANNLFDSHPDSFDQRQLQARAQRYSHLSPAAPEGAFHYLRLTYDF